MTSVVLQFDLGRVRQKSSVVQEGVAGEVIIFPGVTVEPLNKSCPARPAAEALTKFGER